MRVLPVPKLGCTYYSPPPFQIPTFAMCKLLTIQGTYQPLLEIEAAANFLSSLLRGRISDEKMRAFSESLQLELIEHYADHWFPDKPAKGSGYRCIRINHRMDPIIAMAASRVKLHSQILLKLMPKELTLWVDPFNVSYRIGEDGSICVLYELTPMPTVRPPLICRSAGLSNAIDPSQYLVTVSS